MAGNEIPFRSHRRAAAGPRRVRRAFTLFEILLVMSLLVMLVTMALPLMDSQIHSSYFPESTDRLASALFMLRSEAMQEHRRHRLRFEPGEQQPVLEYEPEPIQYPGEWTWVSKPWAQQRILLGDVWVVEVRPGRPAYTLPISELEQPPQDVKQLADAFVQERVAGAGLNNEALLEMQYEKDIELTEEAEQIEIPDLRPPIVFEADGSVSWATLILARGEPTEDQSIDPDAAQKWIVLDGRTGIARVQDAVSDEQLSDPDFFVMREKIELPITEDENAMLLGGELGMAMIGENIRGGDPSMLERTLLGTEGLAKQMPQDVEFGDPAASVENNSVRQDTKRGGTDTDNRRGPVSTPRKTTEQNPSQRNPQQNRGPANNPAQRDDDQNTDGPDQEMLDDLSGEDKDRDANENADEDVPPELEDILNDPDLTEEQKAEFLRLFIESAVNQNK